MLNEGRLACLAWFAMRVPEGMIGRGRRCWPPDVASNARIGIRVSGAGSEPTEESATRVGWVKVLGGKGVSFDDVAAGRRRRSQSAGGQQYRDNPDRASGVKGNPCGTVIPSQVVRGLSPGVDAGGGAGRAGSDLDEVAQFVGEADGAFPGWERARPRAAADHRVVNRSGVGDFTDHAGLVVPQADGHPCGVLVCGVGEFIDRHGQPGRPVHR